MQTLEKVKELEQKKSEEDEDYIAEYMTKKDVDDWFKNNSQLAPALKGHYKTKFNFFVAPGPKHTFPVDLLSSSMSKATRTSKKSPQTTVLFAWMS